MWIGMVVWLLASGQFQGEPWQKFASQEECEAALPKPFDGNRLIFFVGCVHEDVAKKSGTVEFSRFILTPGTKE